MAKTMTTSPMTDQQIERAVELLRAQLRKHKAELPPDAVQQVFGQKELAREWLESLRYRVNAIRNIIVRRVTVDRDRTPEDMLNSTDRTWDGDKEANKDMPRGEGNEVEVFFFTVDHGISGYDLEKEYERRGLKPDIYALIQVHIDDPAFADYCSNAAFWRDAKGRWYSIEFNKSDGYRRVKVRRGCDFYGTEHFAGVVSNAPQPEETRV